MNDKVTIYDTTLRDGMQGVEVSFSLQDKIQITRRLDEMKVDYIEGGFPLSNHKEAAFFAAFRENPLKRAKLVAFGSTRAPGTRVEESPQIRALLEAETPAVAIVGKTWRAHVEKVLGTTEEENLAMIRDSVAHCKAQGREVIFDMEHFFDGYKDDSAYALRVIRTAAEAGADYNVLCDTNGGTLPGEVHRIMTEISQSGAPGKTPLGVHFHDDCGTAVANSLVGVDNGGRQVQGTVNGWGERTGNANLCVVVPNLCLKTDYSVAMAKTLDQLTNLSRFIAEKANIIPDKRQPYVGGAAFSHKAGQHADVLLKAPELMEHIDGSLVGNERRVLLSELSGKATIIRQLEKYGRFNKKSPEVDTLVQLLKNRESQGYEYEAAEASFDLLVRQVLNRYEGLFTLDNYHLESYKTGGTASKTVGRIFVQAKGKQLMGAGVGTGPVETLDTAMRDALYSIYPFLKQISLIDYKVRVLNPEKASAAKVRVLITSSDHHHSWDTVGVSENIIEASWEALVDSFEYYYNNFAHSGQTGNPEEKSSQRRRAGGGE